jgi:transcriptional regulator with XRE-family HTH domain
MTPFEQRRLALGLTQEEVAARVGITQSSVAKWEAGHTKPAATNYPRLAEVLNIPAEEVVRLFAPEAESVGSA